MRAKSDERARTPLLDVAAGAATRVGRIPRWHGPAASMSRQWLEHIHGARLHLGSAINTHNAECDHQVLADTRQDAPQKGGTSRSEWCGNTHRHLAQPVAFLARHK